MDYTCEIDDSFITEICVMSYMSANIYGNPQDMLLYCTCVHAMKAWQ